MLKELYIKNMAVIQEVRVPFSQGFHVLTGDTGAGKSILVEAIGLILGVKASASLIRDGENEAFVEAIFSLQNYPHLKMILQQNDLVNFDDENELIIKRVITIQGKNKVLINHQRSNLSFLQSVTQGLIDFTGQHQQVDLFDAKNDIHFIDAFLETKNVLQDYQKIYKTAKQLKNDIGECEKSLLEKTERLEWLNFQMKEIDKLTLTSEEELQSLKSKKSFAKNAKKIQDFLSFSQSVLTEQKSSVSSQLQALISKIDSDETLSELMSQVSQTLVGMQTTIEDVSFDISRMMQKSDYDSSVSLEDIDEQIFLASQLKRKYGENVEDILQKKSDMDLEIQKLENADQDLESLQSQFKQVMQDLKKASEKISSQRKDVKKKIEKLILQELRYLKMPSVQFIIEIVSAQHSDDLSDYTLLGADSVQFMLAPNPGLKPKPLAQIASGGEASRILLAIKQVLKHKYNFITFIFDEVDTGISGAAVELVGKKLKELSKNFQVICVTHHAQIASMADQHYYIQKSTNKTQTLTRVSALQEDERIQEVARLMGGVSITQKNLEYAKELIKNAR